MLLLSLPCWITWWCKHSFLCDLLSIHGCRPEWKYAAFLPFYVSGSWFPSHWSSALWGHSCIFYLCFDLILTSDRHLQSTPASTLDISTSFTLWTLVSNHINVCFFCQNGDGIVIYIKVIFMCLCGIKWHNLCTIEWCCFMDCDLTGIERLSTAGQGRCTDYLT